MGGQNPIVACILSFASRRVARLSNLTVSGAWCPIDLHLVKRRLRTAVCIFVTSISGCREELKNGDVQLYTCVLFVMPPEWALLWDCRVTCYVLLRIWQVLLHAEVFVYFITYITLTVGYLDGSDICGSRLQYIPYGRATLALSMPRKWKHASYLTSLVQICLLKCCTTAPLSDMNEWSYNVTADASGCSRDAQHVNKSPYPALTLRRSARPILARDTAW